MVRVLSLDNAVQALCDLLVPKLDVGCNIQKFTSSSIQMVIQMIRDVEDLPNEHLARLCSTAKTYKQAKAEVRLFFDSPPQGEDTTHENIVAFVEEKLGYSIDEEM